MTLAELVRRGRSYAKGRGHRLARGSYSPGRRSYVAKYFPCGGHLVVTVDDTTGAAVKTDCRTRTGR